MKITDSFPIIASINFGGAAFAAPPLTLVAEYAQATTNDGPAYRVAWRPKTGEWSVVGSTFAYRCERDGSVYRRSLSPRGGWVRLSEGSVPPICWEETGFVFAEFPFRSPLWRFGPPSPGATLTVPADHCKLGRSPGDARGADFTKYHPHLAGATAMLELDDHGRPSRLRFIDAKGGDQGETKFSTWQPVEGLLGATYHAQRELPGFRLVSAVAVPDGSDDLFSRAGVNRYIGSEYERVNKTPEPLLVGEANSNGPLPAGTDGLHTGTAPAERWRTALVAAGAVAVVIGIAAWLRQRAGGRA